MGRRDDRASFRGLSTRAKGIRDFFEEYGGCKTERERKKENVGFKWVSRREKMFSVSFFFSLLFFSNVGITASASDCVHSPL